MKWNDLKEKIYRYNGLWKNVVVFDTTEDDWKIWFNFINENYKTTTYSKIEFKTIKHFWKNPEKNNFPLLPVNVNNRVVQ